MKRASIGRIALMSLLAATSMAALVACQDRARARIVVPLAPGPAQPEVTPAEGGIEQAAVDAAREYAGRHGARALVVARGGHVVFEHYWQDFSIDSEMRFDALTPVLTALLLGNALNERTILHIDMPLSRFFAGDDSRTLRSLLAGQDAQMLAAVLEKVSRQPFERIVAEGLWKPMGGADLSFEVRDEAPRKGLADVSCCARARIADWLRVGQLLARDGEIEARQYAPPGFVAAMLRPSGANGPNGYFMRVDGRFAARDVAWVGDAEGRLWVVPSLDLVILLAGAEFAANDWDEAMIPDSIIRGTRGWRPAPVGEGTDPRKYAPH